MTMPDEVEQRLRDYFAALLPPHVAQAAFTDVLERLPLNASPGAVFVAAHKVLQSHVRVRPEVEADVLVEEAGLSVSDAANVLGLRVREVREALEAAAAAEAALDRSVGEPGLARGSGAAATPALDRSVGEPGLAGQSGTAATPALDRSVREPGLDRRSGTAAKPSRARAASRPMVTPGSGTAASTSSTRGAREPIARESGTAAMAPPDRDLRESKVESGPAAAEAVARSVREPGLARESGTAAAPAPDQSVSEPNGSGATTGLDEVDATGADRDNIRTIIVIEEETDDVTEMVARSRAGAVLVLVLAVVIAVAALVVAAQGT